MLKELGSIQAFLVERLKQDGRQRGAGSKCMLPQQTMKRTANIHRDDCARHALGCNVVGVETQRNNLYYYYILIIIIIIIKLYDYTILLL